jgi:replicative DNA helicase
LASEDDIVNGRALESVDDWLRHLPAPGPTTGFAELDALTGGLQPGTLTVLASRPAVGRSTLLLNLCQSAAVIDSVPVLHVSLESGTDHSLIRVMSCQARVALHHLVANTLTDEELSRIQKRRPAVSQAPLYLWAPARLTAAQLAGKVREYIDTHGVKIVAIDGIQDVRPEKRSDLREREVGDVVRDIKTMARALNVAVVATAHLNRATEQRPDRRPALDDLRESGAITFGADTIILIHRPDAYERDQPRAGEADLIVAKHRAGPTATITVAFQGHYARFIEFAHP